MTIEELIKLIKDQQSGMTGGASIPAPSATASVPSATPSAPAGSSGIPGMNTLSGAQTGLADLLGPLAGLNPSGAGATGGEIGGAIGSLFGPLGGFGFGMLGNLIGDWVGGGVPREAKSSALGTAFQTSGNPLDALIGQYINTGVKEGHVLSESNPANFETDVRKLGAMLEALTGQRAPSVTATGFNNNPTFNNPSLGFSAGKFKLPPGYEFLSDPTKLEQAFKDITSRIGMSASEIGGKGGQNDWQSVVRELIQQGALQKYAGPLGPAGAGNTSSGAIPNVSLPHPLAQNQPQLTPAPYPV